MMRNFHFFALASSGRGLSGSDRIFIELARNWSKKHPVTIYVWNEGLRMCKRQNLEVSKVHFNISKLGFFAKLGFVVNYITRIVIGIKLGLSINLKNNKNTYIYSTNDFWMDLLPGWLLKMRFHKITWISSFYLAAPSPFKGFDETGRTKFRFPSLKLIVYWLQQQPTYLLTKIWADYVFVTSKPDEQRFPEQKINKKTIVVRGGVRLDVIDKWRLKIGELTKVYDAVFQGRFHSQKGVIELIDIWKIVVEKKPNAKLAMIGDGPLMGNVKTQISNYKLENNVKLLGYVFDGDKKYRIFSQSRMVVHPAIYDSGGMAAAEAMAFGIPAIGFDLKAYKTYYPKGMVKVKAGDLVLFADKTVKLIDNEVYRNKMGNEARRMIVENWVWVKRAKKIFKHVT